MIQHSNFYLFFLHRNTKSLFFLWTVFIRVWLSVVINNAVNSSYSFTTHWILKWLTFYFFCFWWENELFNCKQYFKADPEADHHYCCSIHVATLLCCSYILGVWLQVNPHQKWCTVISCNDDYRLTLRSVLAHCLAGSPLCTLVTLCLWMIVHFWISTEPMR